MSASSLRDKFSRNQWLGAELIAVTVVFLKIKQRKRSDISQHWPLFPLFVSANFSTFSSTTFDYHISNRQTRDISPYTHSSFGIA
jgi:hypothetical protein